jgi:amino acid transporter
LLTLAGFDGVIHMSDEVIDAPLRVPRSMIYTVVINAVFCWAFVIVVLYTIGDYNAVLNSPTGLPIIQVIYQATNSRAATNTLMSFLLIISTIGNFSIIASVSRLIWAFARDKGLPYSEYFAYVRPHYSTKLILLIVDKIHPTLKVPTRCLGLLTILSCLLALINIGSVTAFNAILSLATLAQYISYWFPILFFLIRKLEGRAPAYGPFNLGRRGIPINIFALVWCTFMIIWLPFPTFLPVTANNMNYAGPMWIGCCLLAVADYWITGKNRFRLPKKVEQESSETKEKDEAGAA